MSYRIKPLKWHERYDGDIDAQTIIGLIRLDLQPTGYIVRAMPIASFLGSSKDLKEAQRIAQSWYEGRLLTALEKCE